MAQFSGYRLSEITLDYDIEAAIRTLRSTSTVLIDTETMGFKGLVFLIQFATEEDPQTVHLIRVLRERPEDILRLLDELAKKKLIGHNIGFDLFHLAKLYTVSKCLSGSFNFKDVWAVESIFRPQEKSYEDRLEKAYCFYPRAVVDTLLVAKHTFPMADEFIRRGGFPLYRFPYSCLGILKSLFCSKAAWNKMLLGHLADETTRNYVNPYQRFTVDAANINTKSKRSQLEENPSRYLVKAKISYNPEQFFALKKMALAYGYVEGDSITDFEFLENFGNLEELNRLTKKQKLPTIAEQLLYRDLYEYCEMGYENGTFINYAVRDILLLQVLYQNQPTEKDFGPSLQVDLTLVPVFANLGIYGLKLDKAIVRDSRKLFEREIEELAQVLWNFTPSLTSPTSWKYILHWLRELVAKQKGLQAHDANVMQSVPDTTKETIDRLAKEFPSLNELVIFKKFKKIESLLKHIPSNTDSVFPQFNIFGTVSGRMTSSGPNSQAVPKDRRIRGAYIAPENYGFMVGDFHALEVRLVAYLFRVKNLMEAFAAKRDPHSQTALDILGAQIRETCNLKDASDEEIYKLLDSTNNASNMPPNVEEIARFRYVGKRIGFGVIYGRTAIGLAQELRCSVEEAQTLIDQYFRANSELRIERDRVHALVTRLRKKKYLGWNRAYSKWEFDPSEIKTIENVFGLRRNFTIARGAMQIFHFLAEKKGATEKELSRFPERIRKEFLASVRSGRRRVNAQIQREALNFLVQSVGSQITKRLQSKILASLIPPGNVYRAADLPVIPGMNVHDELHFFPRDRPIGEKIDAIKDAGLSEMNAELDGKFTFEFKQVKSWADRA